MWRIQATLYHQGVSGTPEKLRSRAERAFLDVLEVPADACERIEIALAMVDAIDAQIATRPASHARRDRRPRARAPARG